MILYKLQEVDLVCDEWKTRTSVVQVHVTARIQNNLQLDRKLATIYMPCICFFTFAYLLLFAYTLAQSINLLITDVHARKNEFKI